LGRFWLQILPEIQTLNLLALLGMLLH